MAKSPSKKNTSRSIEAVVAQWANEQLNKSGWEIHLENGSINKKIEEALKTAQSKSGGDGGCRPDAQLMITNGAKKIPVMIEYKGKKGDLESLDRHNLVELKNDKNEFEFKVINKYAVNGAVYYANVIINHTEYKEVLAIGINGYREENDKNNNYEVKAYILNAENPNMPILLEDTNNLDFLGKNAQEQLFESIADKQKSPAELAKKHEQDEARMDRVLKDLNQHLRDESRIQVNHRIAVVTTCLMAALGVRKKNVKSYEVAPLELSDLTGSQIPNETDGDKILNRAMQFLEARKIPKIKQEDIKNALRETLLYQRLGLVDDKIGCSPLRSAYEKVYKNIIPVYHLTGISDFTGKIFNTMNDWVAVPDGDANDIVLTPRYVTDLMARLAEVDKNSYVWDWALGTGGFLISAMNLMLQDNKNTAQSEKERLRKDLEIKSKQLLGVEKYRDIYTLAVLNMILMNDGSTNIINQNSLSEYDGKYAYVEKGKKFPATVFLLNPPYSAEGNGMVFVEKAFNQMQTGKGAIIIQDSAGTGKAAEFNQRILKKNRLLASIKMPADLFRASVQTSIYLFEIGKPHKADDYVKFIDFSEDGYTRSNRKKSDKNLQDTDNAKARYNELVTVVKNGITADCQYFKDGKNYTLDRIAITKPFSTEQKTLESAKKAFDKADQKVEKLQVSLTKLQRDYEAVKSETEECLLDSDNATELTEKIRELEEKLAEQKAKSNWQTLKTKFEAASNSLNEILQHNAKVGCDWNFAQHLKIDTKPTLADFKKTVSNYLAWEVSQILKGQKQDDSLGK